MITDGAYMNKYVTALGRLVNADKREGRNSSSPEMLSRFFADNGLCGGDDEIEYAQESEIIENEDIKEHTEAPAAAIEEDTADTEANSPAHLNGCEVYLTNCLGNRYDIEHLPFCIGRGRNKDMVIDQPTVSGDHAVITEENGHYFVRDLSTNGTYLK